MKNTAAPDLYTPQPPEKAVGDQHTEKSIEAFKSTGQVVWN